MYVFNTGYESGDLAVNYYGKEHFECRSLNSSAYTATLRAITIW